jgi:hypothetical protein
LYPGDIGALSLKVEWLGHKADHSPLKNAWSYTSTPPYVFWHGAWLSTGNIMAWYLVKHKDNFTFTFYATNNNMQ